MISYETIYLIYVILCLMGYTDSAKTTEEQQMCITNLRRDFGYPRGSLIGSKLALPKQAFKKKVFNQLQSISGIDYFHKIMEKAAPGLTESPKTFCANTRFKLRFPPTLCMDQLREVYQIDDENDALSVIKWTYVNKKKSDIPQVFDATNGVEVKRFEHFAFGYFKHMLHRLDVYISIPWPYTFCRNEEPHYRDRKQKYRNTTNKNSGESSGSEMTVKELQRIQFNKRTKSKPDKQSLND